MRDFACHQELQRVFGAGIVTEVDQPLIDDLGAGLGRDVAAQIDVQLAGDLQIVGGPRIAHGIAERDTSAAGDRDQRVGFCGVAVFLHWLEMQPGERADDLQMAEFFGPDVHEQILTFRIFTIETLDRVLHGRGQLSVGTTELLKQHVAETRVRGVDVDRVHEFLNVVIHGSLSDKL